MAIEIHERTPQLPGEIKLITLLLSRCYSCHPSPQIENNGATIRFTFFTFGYLLEQASSFLRWLKFINALQINNNGEISFTLNNTPEVLQKFIIYMSSAGPNKEKFPNIVTCLENLPAINALLTHPEQQWDLAMIKNHVVLTTTFNEKTFHYFKDRPALEPYETRPGISVWISEETLNVLSKSKNESESESEKDEKHTVVATSTTPDNITVFREVERLVLSYIYERDPKLLRSVFRVIRRMGVESPFCIIDYNMALGKGIKTHLQSIYPTLDMLLVYTIDDVNGKKTPAYYVVDIAQFAHLYFAQPENQAKPEEQLSTTSVAESTEEKHAALTLSDAESKMDTNIQQLDLDKCGNYKADDSNWGVYGREMFATYNAIRLSLSGSQENFSNAKNRELLLRSTLSGAGLDYIPSPYLYHTGILSLTDTARFLARHNFMDEKAAITTVQLQPQLSQDLPLPASLLSFVAGYADHSLSFFVEKQKQINADLKKLNARMKELGWPEWHVELNSGPDFADHYIYCTFNLSVWDCVKQVPGISLGKLQNNMTLIIKSNLSDIDKIYDQLPPTELAVTAEKTVTITSENHFLAANLLHLAAMQIIATQFKGHARLIELNKIKSCRLDPGDSSFLTWHDAEVDRCLITIQILNDRLGAVGAYKLASYPVHTENGNVLRRLIDPREILGLQEELMFLCEGIPALDAAAPVVHREPLPTRSLLQSSAPSSSTSLSKATNDAPVADSTYILRPK